MVNSPETSDPPVTTDVAVVEDVQVVANADDLDAAPLAVELTEFGSQTAPASDLLATVGAVGRAAGGFGGRAKAAQMSATGGGSADSEAAVEAALKWCSIHHRPDGSWTTQFDQCPSCQGKCRNSGNRSNTVDDPASATALALLPPAIPWPGLHAQGRSLQTNGRTWTVLSRGDRHQESRAGLRNAERPRRLRPGLDDDRVVRGLWNDTRWTPGRTVSIGPQFHPGGPRSTGWRLDVSA